MRLRRLDLTRYGKFTGKQVEFGPRIDGEPDLHVVYGLNEAGKSTALSAYLDLLFGIEERSRYNFVHPYPSMQVGGVLEFDGVQHELKRVKQRAASLLDASGQPLSDMLLGRPLGSLTRDDYRAMFSLDDETLEAGGDEILASKGEIGRLLFQATAGVGALSDTLAEMEEQAAAFHRPGARKTELGELKKQLAELKSRRDGIDTQASRHAALAEALKQAEAGYVATLSEMGTARGRHAELTRLVQAERPAREAVDLDAALVALGPARSVPAGARARLETLDRTEAALGARQQDIDAEARRLDEEIASYTIDARLLALEPRLAELSDAIGRQDKADEDIKRRRGDVAESESGLRALLARLGRPDEFDPAGLVLSAAKAGTLRDLIEAHGGLDTAVQVAEREQELAVTRRTRVVAELEAGPDTPNVAPALIVTLESALERLRQSQAANGLVVAEDLVATRQAALSSALARLRPWTGDEAALATMAVPDERQLEQWRGRSERLGRDSADLGRRAAAAEDGLARAEARSAALTEGAGAIDDAGAIAARAARDGAWATHLAALDRDTAAAFEARMVALDRLAERRLEHADEVAALRLIETQAAEAREDLAQIGREEARLSAEGAVLFAEMAAEWPHGLPQPEATLSAGRRIEALSHWAAQRDKALVVVAELATARADATRLAGELERLTAQLADALRAVGQAVLPAAPANLATLADAVLRELRAAATAFAASERALEAAEADVASRTAALGRARTALAGWQARWDAALDGTWLGATPGIGAVRASLDVLAELSPLLQRREDAGHRVATMEADRRAFEALVAALYDGLEEIVERDASLGAARALRQRVEAACRDAAQLRQVTAERAGVARRAAELVREAEQQAASRVELFASLGVITRDEALAAIVASEERSALDVRRAAAEAALRDLFGGRELAECRAALEGFERTVAEAELAQLDARLGDLDTASREQFAALRAARDRLAAIGGDDAVARIEAERRTVLLDIEARALAYLRLRAGALLATRALRAYRDTHRSSMLSRASAAFSAITRGAYSGLDTQPAGTSETLIGVTREGGSRAADAMSKGTRFQLYLALRLAGYQEFARLRPAVPFLADDIMETFDEPRSEEVFRLLADMGRIGQTIYFTHHRHLCDMAREVVPGVRVHEL